ncbi:hypothetical protein ACYCWS_003808, partial [Citrobacter farmeri]
RTRNHAIVVVRQHDNRLILSGLTDETEQSNTRLSVKSTVGTPASHWPPPEDTLNNKKAPIGRFAL